MNIDHCIENGLRKPDFWKDESWAETAKERKIMGRCEQLLTHPKCDEPDKALQSGRRTRQLHPVAGSLLPIPYKIYHKMKKKITIHHQQNRSTGMIKNLQRLTKLALK